MNAADLALFEPYKLYAMLLMCFNQVRGVDWRVPARWLDGYPDDAPRTAGWVSRFFGNN